MSEMKRNGAEAAKRMSVGVLVSMGIMAGISAIGAAMISGGTLGEESAGYVSGLALLLGVIFGALVSVRGTGGQRLLLYAVHGGCCFAVLLCLGMLLYDGAAQGLGSTALLCVGGSFSAGLVTLRRQGRRVSGRHRYKIRTIVQNAQ